MKASSSVASQGVASDQDGSATVTMTVETGLMNKTAVRVTSVYLIFVTFMLVHKD